MLPPFHIRNLQPSSLAKVSRDTLVRINAPCYDETISRYVHFGKILSSIVLQSGLSTQGETPFPGSERTFLLSENVISWFLVKDSYADPAVCSHPAATLKYHDEDDGDLITVGSLIPLSLCLSCIDADT